MGEPSLHIGNGWVGGNPKKPWTYVYYATLQAEPSLNLDDFAPLCDEVDQPDWDGGDDWGH